MNIYRRVNADPADWFSADEVAKAKDYQRPLTVVRLVNGAVSLGFLLAVIQLHVAPRLADAVGAEWWVARLLLVLGALVVATTLLDLPSDAWVTFSHDRRWGFSTQTPRGFAGDLVKGLLVSLVLTSALMLPLWALIRTTPLWWVAGWGIFLTFSVLLSFLGPVVLLPLFNRFEPLANDELADSLRELARRAGLRISEVQVMDASKRTRKDNAFFAGLGRTRRVVLYDNMLEQPASSIECVVAHELGHWRRRHLGRMIAFATVTSLGLFAMLGVVVTWEPALRWAGVATAADPAALPLLVVVLVAAQLVLRYLQAWHMRALERQADLDALELTDDPEGFQSMMRGLATRNLSELVPSWLAYLRLDHPPPAERLELARLWSRQRQPQTAGRG